ncbi:MAG: hypothetical protein ACJAWL_000755 [Motiliproteus sp.]|jgi:hypothetical protein
MKSVASGYLPRLFLFAWLAAMASVVSAQPATQTTAEVILISDFEPGSRVWKTKSFQGLTQYTLVDEGGSKVLAAHSQDAASGVFFEIEYSLEDFPILSWRWKIERTLAKGDARTKAGDDYAARIYVVFPHWFYPKTRSINYIWANKLPKGESIANPFTANAMMLALQSGDEQAGVWITERRDVRADYRRLFGEEPAAVGAIAIMTDTDNSHSEARAWFDDLRIESGPP